MWYTMSMPAPQMYMIRVVDKSSTRASARHAFVAIQARNPDEAEEQALIAAAVEFPDYDLELDRNYTKHYSNASEYAQRHATYLGA
jgi:hypothetical protein